MGRLLLLLGSLAVALATPALAQTGDNCSAATPLTVSADCSGNLRVYTTEDNARSTVASACSPNNTSPDAWFSFVATKPGISVRASVEDFADGLSGIRLELYRGDCGRLESIGCGRNPSTIATVSYAASDFVVGQRYFVRVYGNPDATGEFTICVRGFDPPAFQASDCVRGGGAVREPAARHRAEPQRRRGTARRDRGQLLLPGHGDQFCVVSIHGGQQWQSLVYAHPGPRRRRPRLHHLRPRGRRRESHELQSGRACGSAMCRLRGVESV